MACCAKNCHSSTPVLQQVYN